MEKYIMVACDLHDERMLPVRQIILASLEGAC
jgi:hypothetical protein